MKRIIQFLSYVLIAALRSHAQTPEQVADSAERTSGHRCRNFGTCQAPARRVGTCETQSR